MEKDRKTLSDMQDSSGSFDILEWRRTAQSFGHGTLQGLGTGRPHPKVRAAALLRQAEHAPTDLVTDLQTSLGKYGQAVLQFEQCMGRIGSTMAKEAREQTKTLLLGAGSAEDALKELATAVEASGQWKVTQKQDREKKQRKSSVKMGQVTKLLHSQGTPLSLAKHMVSAGWIQYPGGPLEGSWPAFVPTSLVTCVDADIGEEVLSENGVWDRPILFSLSGSETGILLLARVARSRISSPPQMVSSSSPCPLPL